MDLFDYMKEQTLENESPLASRMRPRTLEEVAGQEHIIGKDKLLYRAIKADKLGSVCLLYTSSNGNFCNHQGKAQSNCQNQIYQQKNTAPVFGCQIGKAPEVSKPYG